MAPIRDPRQLPAKEEALFRTLLVRLPSLRCGSACSRRPALADWARAPPSFLQSQYETKQFKKVRRPPSLVLLWTDP